MKPHHSLFLTILINLILAYSVKAQQETIFPVKPFKQITAEVEYFFSPETKLDNTTGTQKNLYEQMINVGLYTNTSRRFQVGMIYNHVWHIFAGKRTGTYYLAGLTARLTYPLASKFRVYFESGLNLSNLCNCLHDVRFLDEIPFERANMIYLSGAGGFSAKIYKNLRLKVGLTLRKPLNKDETIQFMAGFNYGNLGLQLDLD